MNALDAYNGYPSRHLQPFTSYWARYGKPESRQGHHEDPEPFHQPAGRLYGLRMATISGQASTSSTGNRSAQGRQGESGMPMRQLPIFISTTTEEGLSSEEEPPSIRQRNIKSGKVRTADTLISWHIVRPHKVVYTVAGKPMVYDHISLALFVSGHLIAMEGEKRSRQLNLTWHTTYKC